MGQEMDCSKLLLCYGAAMSDLSKDQIAQKVITPFDDVPNETMPTMGNGVTRWIGRSIMRMMGWTFKGKLPEEKKVIFIGAPHTSNWDLIIALSAMMSVSLKCSWMMKKQAFFWPLGGLWKALGGVPIDRSSKNNITDQMVDWFNSNEKAWLGITPEGTRSKVDSYKRGYLRMAYAAGVPIFIIALNGPTKEVVLDRLWKLTFDTDKDNRMIKAHYDKSFKGVKPENG